jgi:hypothetical protein
MSSTPCCSPTEGRCRAELTSAPARRALPSTSIDKHLSQAKEIVMNTTSRAAAAVTLLLALAASAADAAPGIAVSAAIKSDAGRIEPVTYGWHKGCYWHWGYRHCRWGHRAWGGHPSWGYRRWGHHQHWRHQRWSGWRRSYPGY